MIVFSVKSQLYQWNANECVVIDGMDNPVDYAVHFSVNGDRAAAMERFPYKKDGAVVCDIPNTLLTSGAGSLYVYAYNLREKRMYTESRAVFSVIRREKPEGYVYDGDEIAVWAETHRVAVIAADTSNAARAFAAAAAEEAAESAAAANYAVTLGDAAAEEAGTSAAAARDAQIAAENAARAADDIAAAAVRTVNGNAPDDDGNVNVALAIGLVVRYSALTKTATLTTDTGDLHVAYDAATKTAALDF